MVTDFLVEVATGLREPWETFEIPSGQPDRVALGRFESPTPVSYRVRANSDGGEIELWGYFQVRQPADAVITPVDGSVEPQDAKPYENPAAG